MECIYGDSHIKKMSAVINGFTDGFAVICYVKPSTGEMINYKYDITYSEWDIFRNETLTYPQCIHAFSENFVCKNEREKFISELSVESILSHLSNTTHLVYKYHFEKGKEIIHYSVKIISSHDNGIIIGFKDIEKEYRILKSLKSAINSSHTDKLTKLLNRDGIMEKIEERLKSSSSLSAVFFIDIDNFKAINDTHGHNIGDDTLYIVGKIISESTPNNAITGRLGGDEFIVFINADKKKYAYEQAEKICATLSNSITFGNFSIILTASIGISFSDEASDAASLISIADKRMYDAKKNGKNRVM